MSLRGRIVSLTVGAAVAVLLLFAIPLLVLEQRAAVQDVQDAAEEAARGVADYVSAASADPSDVDAYVGRVNARQDDSPVAVILPDGTVYGPSLPGADDVPETRDGVPDEDADGDGDRDGPFLRQTGVDVDHVDGGRLVRVGVRTPGGPTTVVAFAGDEAVRAIVVDRILPLLVAASVLLVAVVVVAELVARRLVRDVDRTADLADAIAAGDRVAPAPEQGPPEVRRVAHALNELAGRIDELLAAERETAADMSHRLRTPLTALRLDVESLPPGEDRDQLELHVANLERTLTAVIHAARRSGREGPRPGCRPGPVAVDAVAYWRPLIEDQGRTMAVAIAPDLPEVHCSADDLRAAMDALLGNAVAHTPESTPIAVDAWFDDASGNGASGHRGVVVDVSDRGPGFDPHGVQRGRSDRGSTGLGLDIAGGCARASGGDISVHRLDRAGQTWTVVRMRLGLA